MALMDEWPNIFHHSQSRRTWQSVVLEGNRHHLENFLWYNGNHRLSGAGWGSEPS
jgi:hypothetical protein